HARQKGALGLRDRPGARKIERGAPIGSGPARWVGAGQEPNWPTRSTRPQGGRSGSVLPGRFESVHERPLLLSPDRELRSHGLLPNAQSVPRHVAREWREWCAVVALSATAGVRVA